MSRGGPKPTLGVTVRLDFTIVFDEMQSTLPVGGRDDVDALFKAIANVVEALKIPHATDVCEARRVAVLAARESIGPGDLASDEAARLIPCPSLTADPPGCGAEAGSLCREPVCGARLRRWERMTRSERGAAEDDIGSRGAICVVCPGALHDEDPGCSVAAGKSCGSGGNVVRTGAVDSDRGGDATPAIDLGDLLALVRDLRGVALETIRHAYLGACPYDEGLNRRDHDCPACAVLVRADAVRGGT